MCSEGFVSRVQYACDSCAGEDGATAVIVILAILLSIFLLVLLWFLLSANATVEQNGIISRVTKNLPIQSLKIVIVVWQILTQVSACTLGIVLAVSIIVCLAPHFFVVKSNHHLGSRSRVNSNARWEQRSDYSLWSGQDIEPTDDQ